MKKKKNSLQNLVFVRILMIITFSSVINNSFCQTLYEGIGYDSIYLGESKKTLLKKIGEAYTIKKVKEYQYILFKNIVIGLDDDNIIDEIKIIPTSDIQTVSGKTLKHNSIVQNIIDSFGEDWGYSGKNTVYLEYETGISFETNYFLSSDSPKDLSNNNDFLNSKIISITISESDSVTENNYTYYEYLDGTYIPRNIDETYSELDRLLKRTEKRKLLKMSEDEFLSSQHFTLGKYIRNEWGLWKYSRLYDYFKRNQLTHPDDISTVILKYYYRKEKNQEFNLNEEVEYYKDYWKTKNKL